MVYSRQVEGKVLTFGISGRLYKSNVLLYDHQTESLWSQLLEKAISGPLAGKKLSKIPSTQTSWKTWKSRNPGTRILSDRTGYSRDYSRDPYEGYARIGSLWFPVGDVRPDLSPKERVLGLEAGGEARAYPLSLLKKNPGTLRDRLGGKAVAIEVTAEGEVAGVSLAGGEALAHVFAYWFAWQAFHPRTTVYPGP